MKLALFSIFNLMCFQHLQAQIKLPTYQELILQEKNSSNKYYERVNKPISSKQIEYYKQLKPEIIKIAAQYGIDPVTLVATPLAENSMNVGIDDDIQDFLVNFGLAPKGEILGKKMSIGPGQINVNAAMDVEAKAAAIEKRPVRTKEQVAKILLTPSGALQYAAAILRNAQDIYKEAGYDISKRPEILSTLYNLGKNEELVKKTKATNQQPVANYFGFFVGQHYNKIRLELGLPSVLYPEPTTTTVAQKTVPAAPVEKELISVITELSSYKIPPICFENGTRAEKIKGDVLSGPYKIISRTVGCELEAWVLVQTENGKSGWVKSADLNANKTSLLRNVSTVKKTCDETKIKKGCETKVSELSQKYGLVNKGDLDDITWLIETKPATLGFLNGQAHIRVTDEMKAKIKSLSLRVEHPLMKIFNSNTSKIYLPKSQLSFLDDPTKPVPATVDIIVFAPPLKVNTCSDMHLAITSLINSPQVVVNNRSSLLPVLTSTRRVCNYCKNNPSIDQGKMCSKAMSELTDLYGALIQSLDKPTKNPTSETSIFDKNLWKEINAESCFAKAYAPESEQILADGMYDLLGKITVSNQISLFSQMMITFKNQCDATSTVQKPASTSTNVKSTK